MIKRQRWRWSDELMKREVKKKKNEWKVKQNEQEEEWSKKKRTKWIKRRVEGERRWIEGRRETNGTMAEVEERKEWIGNEREWMGRQWNERGVRGLTGWELGELRKEQNVTLRNTEQTTGRQRTWMRRKKWVWGDEENGIERATVCTGRWFEYDKRKEWRESTPESTKGKIQSKWKAAEWTGLCLKYGKKPGWLESVLESMKRQRWWTGKAWVETMNEEEEMSLKRWKKRDRKGNRVNAKVNWVWREMRMSLNCAGINERTYIMKWEGNCSWKRRKKNNRKCNRVNGMLNEVWKETRMNGQWTKINEKTDIVK